MVTTATPTAVSGGQRLIGPSRSVENWRSVHCGNGIGLPIRPGGTLKCRSFASPGGCLGSADWFNRRVVVNWKGCEPACVSGEPPSFSGASSYQSAPNGTDTELIFSGRFSE